jgi:branched-chain amino acid transport system permease protein
VSSTDALPLAGTAASEGAAAGVLDSNRRALAKYAAGMALALVPLVVALDSSYWLGIVIFTYLMAGLASAWNIIGGLGGQFSLGHGVFFGIGAYTTAVLHVDFGWSPWLTILPGVALATLVALLISWPTFRLRGPFFAIATMAFNQVAFVIANYIDWPTNGPRGIMIPFKAGFANMIFADRWKYAILFFCFMALATGIALLIRRSRLGYSLLAVREDEDAARAAGIDVLATKLNGMAVSAALTAAGGSLFAVFYRFVDPPSVFGLAEVGVKFALLSLIGGIGTLPGPIVGAALIVPLENFLRANYGGVWPGAHLAVLGAIMVLAALFMRRGIVGAGADLVRFFRRGRTA